MNDNNSFNWKPTASQTTRKVLGLNHVQIMLILLLSTFGSNNGLIRFEICGNDVVV